jgi:hypothetical protein
VNVLTELHDLDTAGGHVGIAAQQVEQADAGVAGKALIDHFQRGHAPTHDPILTGEIVIADPTLVYVIIGLDVPVIDTVQQRINLVL